VTESAAGGIAGARRRASRGSSRLGGRTRGPPPMLRSRRRPAVQGVSRSPDLPSGSRHEPREGSALAPPRLSSFRHDRTLLSSACSGQRSTTLPRTRGTSDRQNVRDRPRHRTLSGCCAQVVAGWLGRDINRSGTTTADFTARLGSSHQPRSTPTTGPRTKIKQLP
jgi:hypothetical protein